MAVNKTWVSNSNGNWNTSGAWSPSGAPNGGEFDVFIDDGDSAVVVTQNGNITINSLTLGSNDTLAIEGTFSSTSLTSDEGITNNGTIQLTGFSVPSARLTISSGALTNSATGQLLFPSGSGDPFFDGDLVNNGIVTIDHNATFDKLGGTYTNNAQFSLLINNTLTINGSGALNQSAGTFDLDGTLTPGTGEFTVSGGTLDVGASGRVINGEFNYLGGTISNSLTLQNTTLIIGAAATNAATFLMNDNNTLASNVNAGQTITVQAGFNSTTLTSNSSFTNAGTINLTASSAPTAFLYLPTAGNDTLTNTGTLRFQTGNGGRVFTGDLVNNGAVEVEHDTTFNKLGATYTNNAQLNVDAGVTFTVANAATLDQDAGTFTLDGELEIGSSTFNMNGGTMNFAAAALIDNGNFNYLGGTIAGDVRLRNTTFTIGPGTNPETFQLNDNNTLASDVGAGHTINVEAGFNSTTLTSNSSFTNAGTINLTASSAPTAFLYLPTAGNDTLTNTGTLRFQTGNGGRVFTGDLVNNGAVEVEHDTTFNKLGATYTNNGQLDVDAGTTLTVANAATLDQDAGTFNLNGELEIGSSTFNTNGGTMNFAAAALIDNGNFNYLGGTINGDVKLRNTTFTIGALTNPETFQLNDNNTLASDVGAGHTINVEAGDNSITLTSNSSFTNAGTINLTSTAAQAFLYLPNAGNDTLTNTGTLRFQTGAGVRVFTGDLVNNGNVEVDYDAIFNKGGATHTNNAQLNVDAGVTFTVANGATLDQDAGTFNLNGELEIGSSTFNMNGGTMNFAAAALIDNGNFNYLGGTIAGDVKLRNTTFTIGPDTNPETFQLNDNNTLASDVGAGHTINVEAGSNSITLTSNSSFTNAGTINLTSSTPAQAFLYLPNAGNDTLTNTGTLRFQTGDGGRVFTGDLVNNGAVEADHDTTFNKGSATYTNNSLLKISNGATLSIVNAGNLTNHSGSTLTGGTFDITGTLSYPGAIIQTNQAEIILRGAGSTIRNQNDSTDALAILTTNGASGKLRLLEGRDFFTTGSTFTNAGLLEFGGTSFTFFFPSGSTTFNNTATGQIIGAGTIDSTALNLAIINAGTVSPGTATDAGILQFDGNYTQGAIGSLAIGIGGTNNSDPQNPQFDVLNIGGSAALGGSLALNLLDGFVPAFSNTFTILDASSLSGAFGNVANGQRLDTLGGEGSFQVNYNSGAGTVVLSNFLINLPGDFNEDGFVDAADYVMWRKSINTPVAYSLFVKNFGRSAFGGGGSAGADSQSSVPEPASALLLAMGTIYLTAGRRK